MRIVVFSDSHGDYNTLRDLIELHDEADIFIHLGDGQREFEQLMDRYPEKDMRCVSGNCDMTEFGKMNDLMLIRGKRVFYTHGHMFDVKHGLHTLEENARGIRADIVMFGHTHQAVSDCRNGLYLFNPGSIGGGGGMPRGYGIVDITEAGIVPNLVQY